MVLIVQPLLDYRLGAYIEGWIRNKTRLLKVRNQRHTLSAASRKQKPTSQKVLHNPWSLFYFLLTGKSRGVQLSTKGLFYPVAGDLC
jgi:hypothetical protein